MVSTERRTGTPPLLHLFCFFALSRVSLYPLPPHPAFACGARKVVSAPIELFQWSFAERAKPVYSFFFSERILVRRRRRGFSSTSIWAAPGAQSASAHRYAEGGSNRAACSPSAFLRLRLHFQRNRMLPVLVFFNFLATKFLKVKSLYHTPTALTWTVRYPLDTARGRPELKSNCALQR